MTKETQENNKVLKDAQYRKGLSIAFFNATNSAISLIAPREIADREEALKEVVRVRDFFLAEYQNYYTQVISSVGVNYKSEDSIAKLEATKTKEELNKVWRELSEDERRDGDIIKVAQKLNAKYKNEKV